jgi:hypothetical protein
MIQWSSDPVPKKEKERPERPERSRF